MKFKKLTVFLIVLTLIVGLVACGGDTDNTSSQAESSAADTSSTGTSSANDSSAEDESSEESGNDSDSLLEGDLEDILAAIYAAAEDVDELELNPEYMVTTEIDPEDCFYYFGVESLDFMEGIASEFEMGGAYSLCLIRAKSIDDVDELKEAIAENANPMKWVCMGVSEDKVVVDNIGDVIILIMYDKSEFLHDIFLALADAD
ncbi:MAG: hypothetical protein PHW77_04440 [Eubacteriales bacterium]|nr:hypothetical protein [Eubacteriales bacterium]